MFVITYSVPVARQEHLRKAISDALQLNRSWCHYIAPTWLVVTDKSAHALAESISTHVKQGKGRLLIMEVKPDNHQGLLPKAAWEWINKWAATLENPSG